MTKKGDDEAEEKLFLLFRKIHSLIWDKRYDEARSLIDTEQRKFPESEAHRFMAFSANLHERLGETDKSIALMRQAIREKPTWLPHLFRLAVLLMDTERWEEADVFFKKVIDFSLAQNDAYFLESSRFGRAVCLKMLGRRDELKRVKAEIPAGTTSFITGRLCQIEDIS